MLAGVITPPLILAGQGGANLAQDSQQYLGDLLRTNGRKEEANLRPTVSSALIVCGILSMVQITRFHIRGTQ
jgi:hypothetical protein